MTTPFVRKILRSKNLKYNFRSLGRENAIAQIQDELIEIDLKRSNPPIRNLIHEAAHHYYPDTPHSEIYQIESDEWKRLSQKDAVRLYRKMFSK